jgi:hypothetical protein
MHLLVRMACRDLQRDIAHSTSMVILLLGNGRIICQPKITKYVSVNYWTPDNTVHGQVNHATTFSFVRVYEAGHEVPFYQPEFALTMFSRAISVSGGKRNSSFQAASPGSQYNTTTGELSSPCTSGVSRITGTLWWMTAVLTLFTFVWGNEHMRGMEAILNIGNIFSGNGVVLNCSLDWGWIGGWTWKAIM